ncbi:Txe/YoeB family addiction module toxin [Pedobacter yonginense]|uniref:Putative mRNA interferase YoeB n=1 Tax=Pedobacter yonginense TaxID=651869 RepID=A0A317ERA0_9SPHI|nr:Txe/YoeB family addiction module toxin [Pedobacter yonginense]PWS28369.1 Txe/YoeB family addiction module toxin [Pedobacter yonginense]
MEIIFSPKAVEHLSYWKKSGNKPIQKKIEQLIKAIQENPFEGIGKPEQLKHELTGYWSRRINEEHRIIYDVVDDVLNIYSLRGHYN